MSNIYRVSVWEHLTGTGVSTHLERGETRDVDGRRYVSLHGGLLAPAGDDWHETAEAARQAAVPRLEQLHGQIGNQIARFKEGKP